MEFNKICQCECTAWPSAESCLGKAIFSSKTTDTVLLYIQVTAPRTITFHVIIVLIWMASLCLDAKVVFQNIISCCQYVWHFSKHWQKYGLSNLLWMGYRSGYMFAWTCIEVEIAPMNYAVNWTWGYMVTSTRLAVNFVVVISNPALGHDPCSKRGKPCQLIRSMGFTYFRYCHQTACTNKYPLSVGHGVKGECVTESYNHHVC